MYIGKISSSDLHIFFIENSKIYQPDGRWYPLDKPVSL